MGIVKMTCPVCAKEHDVLSWSEYGIGTVEFHMYCDRCGYFAEKCYSPVYEGICEGFPEQYADRVRELGLDVVPMDAVP